MLFNHVTASVFLSRLI